MSAFIASALAFPTVVFTVLLALFVLYAIATLVGAADIEWLDGMLGIDDVHDTLLESFLDALGIAGVPLTIFGGVASAIAWLSSYVADRFLPDSTFINSGIGVGAAVLGLGLSSLVLRPFRRMFSDATGPRRNQYVGKICTIRSLQVNDRSGTADIGDLVAEVRCFRENDLRVGSKAIVYDYNPTEGTYHVGPIDASIADVDPAAVIAHSSRTPQAEG
jgi:hypothetical protein